MKQHVENSKIHIHKYYPIMLLLHIIKHHQVISPDLAEVPYAKIYMLTSPISIILITVSDANAPVLDSLCTTAETVTTTQSVVTTFAISSQRIAGNECK